MGVSPEKVIGVDLDDTTLWREVFTRLIGYTKNTILRRSLPKKTLDDIPQLDHTPTDLSVRGPMEAISAFFHFRRTAIPGVAEMLREEIANGTLVYAISGRRATKPWQEMTEAQLIRENIPIPVKNIFLTPIEVSSLDSKADGIRKLRITDFYEDDKRTLLYLAKLFPHVRFNYIDHGLAHLRETDLAKNPNITVIPITQLSRMKRPLEEESVVRNSDLRRLTTFADPAVEAFHRTVPTAKAWHATTLGVAFSIAGIELAEHQNRTGKYTSKTTVLAAGLSLIGTALDLIDGKLARVIRSKITDEAVKARDEESGQAIDPLADGIIEGWQAISSAITAKRNENRFAVTMALLRLATTNLPRTAKAIAGCFGIPVPETYRIKNLLHGDIRPFGTSLGRKIPNYLATLVNTIRGVPVQAGADVIAIAANGIVAGERMSVLLTPIGELTLSDKETRHAQVRAVVLGAESLALIGLACFLGKKFSKEINHQK